MKWAYYNDIDPKVCEWVKMLIKAKLITDGEVDCRSIYEIEPKELSRFARVHLFCGVAGWDFALNLAGWGDRPIFTASCPCQPISCAGKQRGEKDERHLWPELYRLISECRPECIIGEQVSGAVGFEWLDGVGLDLEELNFAIGASDLPAACVNSPQIRQRLYWMAYDKSKGRSGVESECPERISERPRPRGRGPISGLVNADNAEEERLRSISVPVESQQEAGRPSDANAWSRFEVVRCSDGKTRRFEPGSFPLADGFPGRVGLLRGYGNAIVPQLAAEFIKVVIEIL